MARSRLPSPKALVAFEAAARLLSFKQAANELAVTPGAISQQIRTLEETLGTALFTRKARSVTLTPSGEVLSKSVSESFQRIQDTLGAISARAETRLCINTNASIVAKFLLPRISTFSDRFPNIDVDIDTQIGLHSMDADGPDVFIRTTQTPPPQSHHVLLHKELLLPVASPDFIKRHDLNAPQDAARVPLLKDMSLEKFDGTPDWRDWFKKAGLTRALPSERVRFANSGADFLVDMAISGDGLLLGRSSLVYSALSAGQLTCPFGPILPTQVGIYAMCRQEKRSNPRVRAFIGWVKEEAALLSTINALHSAFR
ncbi:LysR substrate-binding domain-containing protein [uncultured Tateyamaria sp.]|uniref:LysR substrate-binding domain-containing protein n=1 Tax=uncultured Tateyamaria sp. TaxID=455651 RepID=UPI0026312C15|nr:LysR substrate-binding domain-containing protein [uncultured Tateyamaria sp.]